jgi:hypothetical protein
MPLPAERFRGDNPSMGWRARLELAPAGVLFAVNCVIVGVLGIAISDYEDRPIIRGVVFVLIMASWITGVGVLVRRREQRVAGARDHDDWTVVVRALWTGDAPADTSFDKGLQTLAIKRWTDVRRTPWLISAFTVPVLIVAIVSPGVGSIVLTCAGGLLSLSFWRERAQRTPRLARLEETLRSRSTEPGPGHAPESPYDGRCS